MWLMRLCQKFIHEEPNHDYDINWDYETDQEVSQEIIEVVKSYAEHIKKTILPRLGIFKDFRVEFVNSLPPDQLAVYINGTYSSPVIAIDVGNTNFFCEESGYDENGNECIHSIKMSILHELYHAVQEANDEPFDEDEAEEFAVQNISF